LQIKTKIVSCHTADSKASQTGGQQYSDASPFSVPRFYFWQQQCPNVKKFCTGNEMYPLEKVLKLLHLNKWHPTYNLAYNCDKKLNFLRLILFAQV
jgi:hypothetical protein